MGLPVVATRSGGPEEIVHDESTGLLVPIADPVALANALGRVLRNREWARSLGARGRDDVRERFARDHMVAQYQAVYEEVLATVGRPARGE